MPGNSNPDDQCLHDAKNCQGADDPQMGGGNCGIKVGSRICRNADSLAQSPPIVNKRTNGAGQKQAVKAKKPTRVCIPKTSGSLKLK